jgi:glutathione peroxidase
MMISEHNPEWLIGDSIKWNFTKFLIDQEGRIVQRYEPTDELEHIQAKLEELLGA